MRTLLTTIKSSYGANDLPCFLIFIEDDKSKQTTVHIASSSAQVLEILPEDVATEDLPRIDVTRRIALRDLPAMSFQPLITIGGSIGPLIMDGVMIRDRYECPDPLPDHPSFFVHVFPPGQNGPFPWNGLIYIRYENAHCIEIVNARDQAKDAFMAQIPLFGFEMIRPQLQELGTLSIPSSSPLSGARLVGRVALELCTFALFGASDIVHVPSDSSELMN